MSVETIVVVEARTGSVTSGAVLSRAEEMLASVERGSPAS